MIATGFLASTSAAVTVCGTSSLYTPASHPTRDELRVLGSEVDDEDGTLSGLGLGGHRLPSVAGIEAEDSSASRWAR
jgi:hypothetical protein